MYAFLRGAAILLLTAASVSAADACKLTVGWSDYPPYMSAGAGPDPEGMDIDLAKAVAADAGCELQFVEVSWTASLKGVEDGTLDAVLGASRNAERDAYAHFTPAYRREQVGLVVASGRSAEMKLADLGDIVPANLRLGVLKDYWYGDRFAELAEDPAFKAQLDAGTEITHNIRKLTGQRIDGFLIDPVALKPAVERVGAVGQVEVHPLAVVDDPMHIMLSRKSVDADTAARFDASVDKLTADGALQKIVDLYLLSR